MRKQLVKPWLMIGFCAVVMFSTNNLTADEDDDIPQGATVIQGPLVITGSFVADSEFDELTQDVVDLGIPDDIAQDLFVEPLEALGERASEMLENGAVSEKQYKNLHDYFINLPDRKRQKIKDFYTSGGAPKMHDLATALAHRRLQKDDASLRDHIKDLRQEGYSLDQQESSRPSHTKELRDIDSEHQDIKTQSDRRGHLKDKQPLKRTRQEIKEKRDAPIINH